jgi:aspartate aminotransferase
MKLSKKAKALTISATMNATMKARELAGLGHKIILASVGEPTTDVALPIKQKLTNQVLNNPSRYNEAQGLTRTRNIISNWLLENYQENFPISKIIITPGSKYALYAIMQILCDDGDEVIIPAPFWVSYQSIAELANSKAVIIDCLDSNYKLTAPKLEKAITKKSRLLILNSPNNPTGAVYSKEELLEIYHVLKKFPEIDILCDDIYNQIILSDGRRAPHLIDIANELNDTEFKDRLLIVHGASKSYSMTGWRIGWIAANELYIQKLTQLTSQVLTCSPDFIQIGLEEALSSYDSYVLPLKNEIRKKYATALKELSHLKNASLYKSEGAFYLWLKLTGPKNDSMEVSDELLQQHFLAGVPGDSFGCPNHIRFSITISENEFNDMLKILKNYFN